MRLTPASREEVRGHYRRSENLKLLDEFANSGMDCAKIEDLGERDACQIAGSLRNSVKRYGFNSIVIAARDGVVYLLKKEDA